MRTDGLTYHSIALKTTPPYPPDPQLKNPQSNTTQPNLKPNPNRETTKEGDSELTAVSGKELRLLCHALNNPLRYFDEDQE